MSHESGPGTCSSDKSEAKGCEHGGVFWLALENSDIFRYFLERDHQRQESLGYEDPMCDSRD